MMQAGCTAELFPGEWDFAEAPDAILAHKRLTAEELFARQCRFRNLPKFEEQYPFAKSIGRKWRADFCFLEHRLIVEVEGLVVRRVGGQLVVGGRHASISGFKEDALKYASAVCLGFTVMRFEQSQVKSKVAIEYTMRALAGRGWRKTG